MTLLKKFQYDHDESDLRSHHHSSSSSSSSNSFSSGTALALCDGVASSFVSTAADLGAQVLVWQIQIVV
jgi:hypothetical protein